jgi:hypothetical protein
MWNDEVIWRDICIDSIAGPGIFACVANHSRFDRVTVYVSITGNDIAVRRHRAGVEAAFP